MDELRWDYVIVFIIFIISGSFHEFAHAYSAYRCGDDTARMAGRMTLNPIAHIDIFGTIIFPVLLMVSGIGILFGWMKPVPVNPLNFRNQNRDDAIISVAGPFANMILALFFILIMKLLVFVLQTYPTSDILLSINQVFQNIGFSWQTLVDFLINGVVLNIVLAIFNLIPVPPLDGGHILRYFIPDKYKDVYNSILPYGFVILIILMISLNYFSSGISSIVYWIYYFLTGLNIYVVVILNLLLWWLVYIFLKKNKPEIIYYA